ncbi:MAG TPA: hypothetical protein VKR56_03325 [Candidatus Cybelea sp.]|nr:hypothetical protein [Candidatus Cybelea sp.]
MKLPPRGTRRALAAALLTLVTSFVLGLAPAAATGTATVRQSDGHVDVYQNVQLKVIHNALFVTTADGEGTLVIYRAACSYQGDLMVCFVTSATLVQAGKTSPLDFKRGTAYVNETDVPQPLALSTTKVPPHSIVLTFTTVRGTYVGITGRFDQVVK